MGPSLKINSGRVRCVRGVPSAPFLIDNNDGTVTDVGAGLMWQKQADATPRTWVDAMSYCEGLTTLGNHSDWRMPNVKELRSIVDTTIWTPAINKTYFTGTTQSWPYWSSTTYVSITSQAWLVDFNDGSTGQDAKSASTYYARCVRSQ